MALNLGTLTAVIFRSKNRTLSNIFQMVVQYNQLPATASVKERSELLHLIARLAGDYLTSKPPQPTATNKRRWDGPERNADHDDIETYRCGRSHGVEADRHGSSVRRAVDSPPR